MFTTAGAIIAVIGIIVLVLGIIILNDILFEDR